MLITKQMVEFERSDLLSILLTQSLMQGHLHNNLLVTFWVIMLTDKPN